MSIYKPSKDKRKALEEALKDLDPATRELARVILENMIKEEELELTREKIEAYIEKLKKKQIK